MPSRLTQTEAHPSGFASFHVTGPAAAQVLLPEEVELAVIQVGPTERYLDIHNPAEPWTTSVSYFRPLAARREGAGICFEVDLGVVFHLETNKPYKLRTRQVAGLETEEVFTAPRLRRPVRPPDGWKSPAGPSGPVRAEPPAPPPPPEPVAPTVTPPEAPATAEPESASAPPLASQPVELSPPVSAFTAEPSLASGEKPPVAPWKWGVLALLLVVAGVIGWTLTQGSSEAGGGDSEPTLASIRADLARNPEPADARLKADALAKEGKLLDGQFLLYKYAGEKGDRDAARVLGGFYDPATWSKDTSPLPAPNPTEAARWLKQAAEAGDAEAQYRYAMLLKSGGTDEATGPEQAVVWLRRAADQGHEAAKKEAGP